MVYSSGILFTAMFFYSGSEFIFLLNTPLAFFCWFFFRNVTETYELHNDTCFPSVMLRNLTDYIIIPFLPSRMLQNFTNCALTLPFNFRHVTELHGLCYNAFLWTMINASILIVINNQSSISLVSSLWFLLFME